jgi:hypothetical protein
VADGEGSRQARGQVPAGEGVADIAHVSFGMETVPVEAGDAARFLSAVLKGVQPERSDRRGVLDIEDPEDAAFQPRSVVVRIPG